MKKGRLKRFQTTFGLYRFKSRISFKRGFQFGLVRLNPLGLFCCFKYPSAYTGKCRSGQIRNRKYAARKLALHLFGCLLVDFGKTRVQIVQQFGRGGFPA
nr:MAG TPA: hypothetical protein [Caudoviricetes sp.]